MAETQQPQQPVTMDSLQRDISGLQQVIRTLTERMDAGQSVATGGEGSVPVVPNDLPSSHLESARRDLKLKLARFNGKLTAWHTWRQEFLSYASLYNFLPALTREPPIRTAPINRDRERAAGTSDQELAQAELAWCYLIASMTDIHLKSMVMDEGSPTAAWKALNEWFSPKTPGRVLDLFTDFINTSLPPGGSPLEL